MISNKIINPDNKYLGELEFQEQIVAIDEPVGFSTDKEFGGIKTVFTIEKENLQPDDYSINEGVIIFHATGNYRVTMTNAAIVSHPEQPAATIVPIIVADMVPVTEIINVPKVAVMGTPLHITGTVLSHNATNKVIVWEVKDAGATGAARGGLVKKL